MSFNRYNTGNESQQIGSGSGVMISAEGYIVTNNHVVEKADGLMVTLNNKKDYKAEIIGTDPSTDLAIIKITGNSFPYLDFGNSDDVHIGQWVLAIGYPLHLKLRLPPALLAPKPETLASTVAIATHQSSHLFKPTLQLTLVTVAERS